MTTDELVRWALNEDLPTGEDITTDSLIDDPTRIAKAQLLAKEDLVLSGTEPFEKCFRTLEPNLRLQWFFKPGDLVLSGQTVALLEGEIQTLLKAERTALNFLGHLSGVATLTRCFVEAVRKGSNDCRIVDTRKTLPLLRKLEKRAVVHGGGENHRLHLGDEILVKENHRRDSKNLFESLKKISQQRPQLRITVECENLDEVKEASRWPIHCVLLDNMTIEEMKSALEILPMTIESEASGNMTLERVEAVASIGIRRISVGALTHSAPNADFSLLIKQE